MRFRIFFVALFMSSISFAALIEESFLEIGYHQSESIRLKKFQTNNYKAYYIVRTFNNKKALIQTIGPKEYERRNASLVSLKAKLQNREPAVADGGCPRYVKIKPPGPKSQTGDIYCGENLNLEQNQAITSWWKYGR